MRASTPILDPAAARTLLDAQDFPALFREHLGWDRHDHPMEIPIAGTTFKLSAIAEKKGFAVFLCSPDTRGRVPERATRDAIERSLAKTAHEHLLIFTDKDRRHQVWTWVRRVPGKPASQRSYDWFKGQATGQILQRVLPTMAIAFEEDDATTLPDVRARVAAAFDVEKVTKKFFERFQKEHAAFHKFIDGIKVEADRDWYASVMLNRLMFCYFIQKKGLLDGDTDYLRNRLARLQTTKGKDKFWTFYQHFLLRLFHEGLSTKPAQRSKDLDGLIGRIPYLNGGLFDIHEIEERYTDIEIPDKAFEQLFKFFDEYRWHLDERQLRDNNEINPDVLGYIFEKYINQKQMGAYYTKEDITGYISQNTINLHALCTERCIGLLRDKGRISFIVQLPLVSSSRMQSARRLLKRSASILWTATFDDRPGKLFDGLQHCRSTIFIAERTKAESSARVFVTRYHRWPTSSRPTLFPQVQYVEMPSTFGVIECFPKVPGPSHLDVLRRLHRTSALGLGHHVSKRPDAPFVFYQEATQYWVKASVGVPFYKKNGKRGAPAHGRSMSFSSEARAYAATAIMNSSLFYLYYVTFSDCFHLSDTVAASFPTATAFLDDADLTSLGKALQDDIASNAERKTIRTKDGDTIEYAEFACAKSRALIDAIDRRLGQLYDIPPDEIDTVLGFDAALRDCERDEGEAEAE
jgi:hypothetical protein